MLSSPAGDRTQYKRRPAFFSYHLAAILRPLLVRECQPVILKARYDNPLLKTVVFSSSEPIVVMLTMLRRLLLSAIVLGVALWSYRAPLQDLAQRWSSDPEYSHGFAVPVFSVYLLWHRRTNLQGAEFHPSLWGLFWLVIAVALRFAGTRYADAWLVQITLVPWIAGLILLAGGKAVWRWAWPAVFFLVFMIPLPQRVEIQTNEPLQRITAIASAYTLQTFGYPALPENNLIYLDKHIVEVTTACNGMSMFISLYAVTTGLALIIERTPWQRIGLMISALPIAFVVNIVRISATAILFEANRSDFANVLLHDYAGWAMIPLALGMMAIELALFRRLLLEPVN